MALSFTRSFYLKKLVDSEVRVKTIGLIEKIFYERFISDDEMT